MGVRRGGALRVERRGGPDLVRAARAVFPRRLLPDGFRGRIGGPERPEHARHGRAARRGRAALPQLHGHVLFDVQLAPRRRRNLFLDDARSAALDRWASSSVRPSQRQCQRLSFCLAGTSRGSARPRGRAETVVWRREIPQEDDASSPTRALSSALPYTPKRTNRTLQKPSETAVVSRRARGAGTTATLRTRSSTRRPSRRRACCTTSPTRSRRRFIIESGRGPARSADPFLKTSLRDDAAAPPRRRRDDAPPPRHRDDAAATTFEVA